MKEIVYKVIFFSLTSIIGTICFAQNKDSSKPKWNEGCPSSLCNLPTLPSIYFDKNAKLSLENKKTLLAIIAKLNTNPYCKVKVIGYSVSDENLKQQRLSYDRVLSVVNYLVSNNVSSQRIIFIFGVEGSYNKVDLLPTVEDGPPILPRPS